jgi:hypothetical protein
VRKTGEIKLNEKKRLQDLITEAVSEINDVPLLLKLYSMMKEFTGK